MLTSSHLGLPKFDASTLLLVGKLLDLRVTRRPSLWRKKCLLIIGKVSGLLVLDADLAAGRPGDFEVYMPFREPIRVTLTI